MASGFGFRGLRLRVSGLRASQGTLGLGAECSNLHSSFREAWGL